MAPHDDNPWAKEYEENSTRQKASNILGMTWTTGEHSIRILPPMKNGDLPFVKYMVHWVPVKTGKKDRPIIHAVETKCPVCKYVSSIWSEVYRLKEEEDMTDDSPEVKKLVKQISKLRGKKTYDMNILDREDYRDDKGKIKIKRLVAGPTIWKPIIELGNSEKWGNPSASGKRGYDLTVTVDGEGIKREYTLLPDPDRKALTEDELEALNSAYDLVSLRKFTTVDDILDILENAKAPLDSLDLKKVKKDLLKSDSFTNDDGEKSKKSDDDDDDDNSKEPVVADDDNDDEDEDAEVESRSSQKQNKKEEKAFKTKEEDSSDEGDSEDEDNSPDDSGDDENSSDDSSSDDSSDDDVKLEEMDCRGTHDPDDIGCKECSISGECKKLQKEFSIKVEKFDIDTDNMSGAEIETAIKEKEKEAEKKAEGKMGKAGRVGKGKAGKRDLPF